MEIYLSHMMIFRIAEKCGLNRIFGDDWLQYIVTVVMVIIGATAFSLMMQRLFKLVGDEDKEWGVK